MVENAVLLAVQAPLVVTAVPLVGAYAYTPHVV